MVFEHRRGRTIVAHAYVEPPFRIGRAFAIGDAAYVIVVCSGPGVFAGDALRQSVHVERGARVVLTSQSALQVHPGVDHQGQEGQERPPAVVRHEYRVDEDAELHCHWDPVIPFAGAALVQQFAIDLHETSRLYWSDALMSGRASRGESWRFRELAHELRLRVGESGRPADRPPPARLVLKYLERYRLTPRDRDVTRTWVAGDANYFATTLVHHPRVTPDEVEALHRQLDATSDDCVARVAVDRLEPSLMVARTMAARGVPFATARAAIRQAVLASIFQESGLVGRK